MNYILLISLTILIAACISSSTLYFKEREARIRSEKVLAVVREMGEIDDRIFRIMLDDPEDWPASPESKMLIARRVELHEWYSTFLGHQLLRDCIYMTDLMKSAISK